jgi:hypothetical protein
MMTDIAFLGVGLPVSFASAMIWEAALEVAGLKVIVVIVEFPCKELKVEREMKTAILQ